MSKNIPRRVEHFDEPLGKCAASGGGFRNARAESATVVDRRAQLIIDSSNQRRAEQPVGRPVCNQQTEDDEYAGCKEQPAAQRHRAHAFGNRKQ
jgi:hypothetical protein